MVHNTELECPLCGDAYGLHQGALEVWNRVEDQQVPGIRIEEQGEVSSPTGVNPSYRRNGVRIEFWCEQCSVKHEDEPVAALLMWQHKGTSYVSWDLIPTGKYGTEVNPTQFHVLEQNLREQRRGTEKQVATLDRLCHSKGITQTELVRLGVQERRLHPDRANLVKSDASDALLQLSFPEIGGLFAFVPWLKSQVE